MWEIQDQQGRVLIDIETRIKPVDPDGIVVGQGSVERKIKLFETEEEALRYMAAKNFTGCIALEHAQCAEECCAI